MSGHRGSRRSLFERARLPCTPMTCSAHHPSVPTTSAATREIPVHPCGRRRRRRGNPEPRRRPERARPSSPAPAILHRAPPSRRPLRSLQCSHSPSRPPLAHDATRSHRDAPAPRPHRLSPSISGCHHTGASFFEQGATDVRCEETLIENASRSAGGSGRRDNMSLRDDRGRLAATRREKSLRERLA